ncbi:MAG: hypothetical protein Q7W45_00915 [Bacteroidota bacterium]|jgi:hypothetical protein|nr:hypothetical protein [Bacteroidota bacterium]MDP3146659.1 hypothetical protein [Bacteroidota bacterium]
MIKLIHILFTIYFTLVSSGVLYSKHYCGTRVSHSVYGISLGSGSKCGCSHESEAHNKGCCKSETKILKAETQKVFSASQCKISKPFELSLLFAHTFEFYLTENRSWNHVIDFVHPPPKPPNPLFILNRNLLI